MTTDIGSEPTATELLPLVQAEKIRLVLAQMGRLSLPRFVMDSCAAWTAWHLGMREFALGWLALITLSQAGRTAYLLTTSRRAILPPAMLLVRHRRLMLVMGCLQALLTGAVFSHPLTDSHYILTMIMVGAASGAVATVAGEVRAFVSWAIVFGGALALGWLSQRTIEGTAIAALLVLLFATLASSVRDQGITLVKLIKLGESLRRERDRAERASRAKTQFFAAASHDLRQPLTALAYNAASVQALAQASGDATLQRVGAGIGRALAESRSLLDSLLEISELDAGAVVAKQETVDIRQLLATVAETLAPVARERRLSLICNADDTAPLIARTDPALLRRIVLNLVGNALKFTQQGWVSLAAREVDGTKDGKLLIVVADSGPGIPDDGLDRVFEEFYQIGNFERDRSRGLGLGLAMVRRLAVIIGANVTLRSEPGSGSIFEVELPTRVEGADIGVGSMPPVAPRPANAPPPSARKVLFVDDEPEVRDALEVMLQLRGWEVLTAADGTAALAALRNGFVPDALLLDFRLGNGASGLDVLRALREAHCKAPAWLITGDTEPTRIQQARAAGIPVLYKPVDSEHLIETLNRRLEQESQR